MASGMVSRWPVLVTLPVTASDCDEDGRLTDAAVDRFFAVARAAYIEQCTTVDPSTLEIMATSVQPGSAPAHDHVTVSVNVTEVFPDRFTMTARLRAGGDGIAATARCSLSPRGPASTATRDEFVALAHAAAHIH
jgi:acyl-CoA thioesterase FadM